MNDRILGMVFGHALGSAVGLQSRFKQEAEIKDIVFPFDPPAKNYSIGDWSAVTDHLVVVMSALMENADVHAVLFDWSKNGIPAINNKTAGLRPVFKTIIQDPEYTTRPMETVLKYWKLSGKKLANNSGLNFIGLYGASGRNFTEVIDVSRNVSADPRCSSACVALCILINAVLYTEITPEVIDNVMQTIIEKSREVLKSEVENTQSVDYISQYDTELAMWIRVAFEGTLLKTPVDELSNTDHVYKSLSFALFILKIIKMALLNDKMLNYEKIITKIAGKGGDSESNCAIAGMVIGAHLGYSKLPKKWLNALPHHDWLHDLTLKFIEWLPNNFVENQ